MGMSFARAYLLSHQKEPFMTPVIDPTAEEAYWAENYRRAPAADTEPLEGSH